VEDEMKSITDAVCIIIKEVNEEISKSDGSPDCQNRINQLLSDALAIMNANAISEEYSKK
jgi:hypothetical protein